MVDYQELRYALSRRFEEAVGRGLARFLEGAMLPSDVLVALGRTLTEPRLPRYQRERLLALILNPSLPGYLQRPLPPDLAKIDSASERLLAVLDIAFNQLDPCLVRELWPGEGGSLDLLQRSIEGAEEWRQLGFREGFKSFLLKRNLFRGLIGPQPEELFEED